MRGQILVTGAAGFIAFHVIESLLRQGHPVVGIDNFDPFYDRDTKESNLEDLRAIARQTQTPFQFIELNVCDLSTQFLPRHHFSEVIHLAAKAGVRPSLENPEAYLRANVLGTLRVLEYCRNMKIPRMLFASSSSVYGDSTPVPFSEREAADHPVSPYAASKRSCELYCANYAHLYRITIASLRFFTVYGPRQRPDLAIHKFARQIARGESITLFGDGSTERDYTYATDILSGIHGALAWTRRVQPGTHDVFNLGGSKTTSLKALVQLIEKNLGISAKIKWAPPQPGDVQRTYADVSKAQRELGYEPKLTPEDGIARFADWFKAENPQLFARTDKIAA